jgi:hypothetical protein
MLKLPDEWRVSIDTQRGRSVTKYRGLVGADGGWWQQLVDRGLYNPLRDTQVAPPPAEFYDRVLIYAGGRGRTVSVGDYETLDTAVRITNPALRLPTGRGALNVGGDFRMTELKSYTDEQRFGDGALAAVPVHWRGRTLQRLSLFGELQAPLLPAAWRPGWLHELELDLAARYTAADSTQETNVAPTAGLKIALAGGLTLRGSFATTNRLPTPFMSEKVVAPVLHASSAGGVSYVRVFDPARQETYGVRAGDAINPDLRPESALTRSAGVIYERGTEHRVRVAVDFVDTQKSGELTYLDAQSVLDLEELFPNRIVRAAPAAGDPHAMGRVSSVLGGTFNLAWRHSQSVATSVDYTWAHCRGGRLEAYARWLDLVRFDRQLLPYSAMVDELNAPDGATTGLLRQRANFGGGWSNRAWGFRLDGHYFDSRTLPAVEWASQGAHDVDPYWQFDVGVQKDLARWLPWKLPESFTLEGQLRVNNLLNAGPPRYANDPSGAGVQSYDDWRRQTYSLSVRARF